MTRYAAGRYHRASGTRNAFAAWSADLVAEGYPEPVVNSGDREAALQEQIFRAAYVPSSGPRDVGPFNDRRFWAGHGWWKRVNGNATIAAPGGSNHEKRRASDLAYPYDRDTPAHRRGQVLAKRHNITCEGMGFREWWHWTFWGPLGTIDQPGSAAGASSADIEPEILNLGDLMSLRIIDSPFYRASGMAVIHNGSSAMAVEAGIVNKMTGSAEGRGRVEYVQYDDDNMLATEVNLVWQLGGFDAKNAAEKTAEMLKKLPS